MPTHFVDNSSTIIDHIYYKAGNQRNTVIPCSMVCETITRTEIINIVHAFKDSKSPGPDNIGPKLLKSTLNDVIDPLVYICNLSFSTGCVPDSFKIAKVIPIFKKGDKTNQLQLSSNFTP